MTVKIIEMEARRITCYKCNSLLEFTFQDTEEVKRTDYLGDTDIYQALTCPVCKTRFAVST